eukprot:TRINITY_DN2521_c0_g1_i1.p1 TRINITY_DN2521_c0_g1~~TRINITY_DN2521_c0_g1_i1.p1  ORF type:complete len:882 (-),score=351.37 TRINITY_DN2521_c0_g1_i1:282-2927(-)
MEYGGGYDDENLDLDDFNDETFGSGPIGDDEWEPDYDKNNSFLREKPPPKNNLPAFFSGQNNEDFMEAPLEGNDSFYLEGALENEEEHFPTSRSGYTSNPSAHQNNLDYFYFNDQENETNAHFDSQMESMFSLVLDDEDEPNSDHFRGGYNSGYGQGYNSPSIWEKNGKDIWSSPNTPDRHNQHQNQHQNQQQMHYGGHQNEYQQHQNQQRNYAQQQQQHHQNQHVPHPSQQQQGAGDNNPLAKFFGGMIPQTQGLPQLPPISTSTSGVLSLEELEARMKQKGQQTAQNEPQNRKPEEKNGRKKEENQPAGQSEVAAGTKQSSKGNNEEAKEAVFNSDAFPALGAAAKNASPSQQNQNFQRGSDKGAQVKMNWTPVQRNQGSGPQVSFANNPNRQLYSANNLTGSQSSRGGANSGSYPRRDSNGSQFRPRWRESKSMMTADEIDAIIRMQESQLHAAGTNPYAEDYYHQSLIAKQKALEGQVVGLHKPLFESNARIIIKRTGIDPLEGVLGRIPSHSVRAPRPLLQIKLDTPAANSDEKAGEEKNASAPDGTKAIQGLLLTIETAYNLLLDIEDIDSLLKNAQNGTSNHVNPAQLKHKRDELTTDLYESLHIFSVPFGTLPQRTQLPEEQPFIYQEDSVLLNISLVQKGKKLVVRTLPLLFQAQLINIYNVFMRNLAIFASSPRLEYDLENSNKLFAYLTNITHLGSISQTILTLQSILVAHIDIQLIQILQSKFGLNVVQNILKKGHDLGLSFFSRDTPNVNPNSLPAELAQLSSAGHHWRETIKTLANRLRGNLNYVLNSEVGNSDKIWEFFAILVVNISGEDKYVLMQELRDKILTTPRNQTLNAFLQLASETSFPLPTFPQQSNSNGSQQSAGPTQA